MISQEHQQLAALLERVGRLLGNDAHASILQPVQWEALRYLEKANRFSRSSSALTAYLGLTKGTVSQTVKALESKGLVHNRVNAKDRRRNQLMLTDKGRELLRDDPAKDMIEAIATLPAEMLVSLTSGLGQLLTSRLQSQGRQAFGQCRDCMYFARQHENGTPHYCMLLDEPLSGDEAEAICFEQVAI